MTTRQDYIAAVEYLVGGDLPLGEAERIMAIGQAVKAYSKHRPRVVVEDESGDGGFDYAISLLAEWADDYSSIRSVEYPVDDTDPAADLLDENDWTIYDTPAGKVVRFLAEKPATGESFRVKYTALQICTDSACSIPAADEEAVQALAAAFFCDMLAAYFSQDQDSTVDADTVDHARKGSEYAARAKMFRAQYSGHLGIQPGKPKAACAVQDQDVNYPGGTDRLTHPRRYR